MGMQIAVPPPRGRRQGLAGYDEGGIRMQQDGERSKALRLIRTGRPERKIQPRPRARTIAIVSGKGGVGKTTLVANLAIALQSKGRRTLILDGDLGMANVDIHLGIVPRRTLHDVVIGECTAGEALVRTPEGVALLPGVSGVHEMAELDDLRCERLLRSLSEVESGCDLILIDTAPGIHRATLHLARAADEVVIVTTPEPTSLTDAYASLRLIHSRGNPTTPWIVVNQAADRVEAHATAERIRATAKRFLSFDPGFLGFVLDDPAVATAVRRQEPMVRLFPESRAADCIDALAERLIASIFNDPDGELLPSGDTRDSEYESDTDATDWFMGEPAPAQQGRRHA